MVKTLGLEFVEMLFRRHPVVIGVSNKQNLILRACVTLRAWPTRCDSDSTWFHRRWHPDWLLKRRHARTYSMLYVATVNGAQPLFGKVSEDTALTLTPASLACFSRFLFLGMSGTPHPVTTPSQHRRACLRLLPVFVLILLGGCATQRTHQVVHHPAAVRTQIELLMPIGIIDHEGWARDIQTAVSALDVSPSKSHLCAALAVIAQESSFHAEPTVPGLAGIARKEIYRRAESHHIPRFMVDAALRLRSPDGKSYGERLAKVRTESELSRIYEDLVGSVPLGRRLFGDANPVDTGGPMQVSIDFAEQYASHHTYPYPLDGTIRREVFTRRGGVYFGIAHLLAYPVSYNHMLYRFADYNAGFYASRNAAFQHAVSLATGIPLALDGDLLAYGSDRVGATERAVRALGPQLGLSERRIHRALEKGESLDFEKTKLYRHVFELAERAAGHSLPHAMLPRIRLHSPKITRKLTTAWFAKRVDQRYRACINK